VLKAQHPEFEMWSQGIHARSGVSCADCHMPYKREGAMKFSDHQVRQPDAAREPLVPDLPQLQRDRDQARVETIQDRTKKLLDRAESGGPSS
jgi:nitrite reductase (cytochrome c-552)